MPSGALSLPSSKLMKLPIFAAPQNANFKVGWEVRTHESQGARRLGNRNREVPGQRLAAPIPDIVRTEFHVIAAGL